MYLIHFKMYLIHLKIQFFLSSDKLSVKNKNVFLIQIEMYFDTNKNTFFIFGYYKIRRICILYLPEILFWIKPSDI